jgi:hypothetical protein
MAKSKYLRPRVEGDKPCKIEGCEYRLYAKGLCMPHYNRNLKYGDPLAGGTPWGAVRKWLDNIAVPYDGDECLTFPFARDECGYGKVRINGTAVGAHAYVLSRRHSPRPQGMECCHSCGNGHAGCVTFKHLRWDTHANNMAESVAHGTSGNGPPRYAEAHHDFRATDEVVANILADLKSGMTQVAVAKKYGFGGTHISRIKNGWRRANYERLPADI